MPNLASVERRSNHFVVDDGISLPYHMCIAGLLFLLSFSIFLRINAYFYFSILLWATIVLTFRMVKGLLVTNIPILVVEALVTNLWFGHTTFMPLSKLDASSELRRTSMIRGILPLAWVKIHYPSFLNPLITQGRNHMFLKI